VGGEATMSSFSSLFSDNINGELKEVKSNFIDNTEYNLTAHGFSPIIAAVLIAGREDAAGI